MAKNKTNPAERALELIPILKEKKAQAINEAAAHQIEAGKQAKAAADRMEKAMAAVNLAEYAAAKAEKEHAETVAEMYAGRIRQIQKAGAIPEAESDAEMDKLLEYEKELDSAFNDAVFEHCKALREAAEEYAEKLHQAEAAIASWHLEVCYNYKDRGNNTRSDKPMAIHQLEYRGDRKLIHVRQFLDHDYIKDFLRERSQG